jgi:hypothetical protein
MKILFIADYLTKKPEFNNIELIVLLGDLRIEQLHWIQEVSVPIIGVYGNHCSGIYFNELKITNAHLKHLTFANVNFFGLEGCVKYSGGNLQYSQQEYSKMLENFISTDVFISHCPPSSINDNPIDSAHNGIDALLNKIDNIKLFVHGHTYPKEKWSIYNNTWILYVHGCEVVDLNILPDKSTLQKSKSYGNENIQTSANPLTLFLNDE